MPTSPAPIDGQEFILVDSLTAPTTSQHFRYTSSVTGVNKWVPFAAPAVPPVTPPVGLPAGAGCVWFSNTPPTDYVICDGSTITGAQTTYPVLWANVDSTWKSGSDIILPDLRGRIPVGKGIHTDVAALGASDGIAVGSRRPKHKHTAAVGTLGTGTDTPDHTHTVPADTGAAGAGGNLKGNEQNHFVDVTSAGASARHTHSITGAPTVGPQTGAEPTDSPAFIVVNWIIKLR